jgi:hypothetical protein
LCQAVVPTPVIPVSRYHLSGPRLEIAQSHTVIWASAEEDEAHRSLMGQRLEMAYPDDSQYSLSRVTVAFSLQTQDTRSQIPRIAAYEIGLRGKQPKD